MINRRQLLTTTAMSLPALALVACASNPGLPAQLLSDVQTLAAGISGVLPALGAIKGIDSATVAKVGGYVADLQQVASTVQGATSTTAAQPIVKQIEGYVNAIVGVAAPLLAATPAGPILMAATVLLPVIETAVGLVVPPAAGPMTVDQARLILTAVAATR